MIAAVDLTDSLEIPGFLLSPVFFFAHFPPFSCSYLLASGRNSLVYSLSSMPPPRIFPLSLNSKAIFPVTIDFQLCFGLFRGQILLLLYPSLNYHALAFLMCHFHAFQLLWYYIIIIF